MATIDEILDGMAGSVPAVVSTDEMLVIDPNTRQISIPGGETILGVEFDSNSDRKVFYCPRYVGNDLDLAACFLRINYRNANGEIDSYLVEDPVVSADAIVFTWVLSQKVLRYKGQVGFTVCAVLGKGYPKWHTTLATGIVLEGNEPDAEMIQQETADVVTQLIELCMAQRDAVMEAGAGEVARVTAEGTAQVSGIKTAGNAAKIAAVNEIEAKGVNTRDSIPDDYTALSEAVEGLTRATAPGIVCEASGTSVYVEDASDQAVRGLRIFGRSTQDGVPTPDAPVEIVSVESPVVTVCGKNLFKTEFESGYSETLRGVTFTVNSDRSIHVTGIPTAAIAYNIFEGEVLPVGEYFISGAPATSSQKFRLQVNLKVDGTEKTGSVDMGEGSKLTVDASVSSLRGYIYVASDAGEVDGVFYPQIEAGSVATDYEPYSGQRVELPHTLPGIPVTSGGNYTDSDGQSWVCDEVDLERGVYVQRVKNTTVNLTNSGTLTSGYVYGLFGTATSKVPETNFGCLAEKAKRVASYDGRLPGCFYENDKNIVFIGDAEDTLATLQEKYNGSKILYVLATPIETPLTEAEIAAYRNLHTNYPNTTVLNDSGAHMVVKYTADTKRYIDNKIAALVGG